MPDPRAATITIAEARDLGQAVVDQMIGEAVFAQQGNSAPEGNSVQGLAFTIARARHPDGSSPFCYWIAEADNLDEGAADTIAMTAIPDFIARLNLPFSFRAEICRRIMTEARPLQDQASFIVGALAPRKG